MIQNTNNIFNIQIQNNHYCQDVTVGLATQPHRINQMLKVVDAILPQCTRMCVALNNYDYVPDKLKNNKKIIYILTGKNSLGKNYKYEDFGAQNKMFWINYFPGFYATVDDDLNYPDNYISELKKKVIKYKYKVICSFHGMIHEVKNGELIDPSKKIYFWQYFNKNIGDHICHRVGMGVGMCYPSEIGLTSDIYLNIPKNYGDDQITAIFAQIHNIKLICVDNTNVNITPSKESFKGLYRNKTFRELRNMYMKSYKNWKIL